MRITLSPWIPRAVALAVLVGGLAGVCSMALAQGAGAGAPEAAEAAVDGEPNAAPADASSDAAFREGFGRAAAALAELPDAELLPESSADLLAYSLRTVVFLAVICLLGFMVVKLWGPKAGVLGAQDGELIRVLAMKRLDPKTSLYVIEAAGQQLLVSVSDREVRPLATGLDPKVVETALAEANAKGRSFASLLRLPKPKPKPATKG